MRFYPIGGGGVGDLDQVTAGAEHVLESKVIVDKDGNPITGTMANRTGTALTVATNGQTLIPQGYHDGTQYAKNTQATLAGGTLTPSTSQVTASCNGKLMTSNYVIPAFSLPSASVIKRGTKVTIYGKSVTGTFEGYVSDVLNIYNAGTWSNISTTGLNNATNNNSYYRVTSSEMARTNATVDLTNYKYLKIQARPISNGPKGMRFRIAVGTDTTGSSYAKSTIAKSSLTVSSYFTGILDVSSLSGNYYIYVGDGRTEFANATATCDLDVNKIYLSKT